MNGRIYVELHLTFLRTKYTSFVVSEKKALSCISIISLWKITMFLVLMGPVGRIYEEVYYTLLHNTNESSGPCGFREEDFFMFVPL